MERDKERYEGNDDVSKTKTKQGNKQGHMFIVHGALENNFRNSMVTVTILC